eukprot:scaffold377919_cov55-Attheya_sp.AAC.2
MSSHKFTGTSASSDLAAYFSFASFAAPESSMYHSLVLTSTLHKFGFVSAFADEVESCRQRCSAGEVC